MARRKAKPPAKACRKKGHVVELTGFYSNKDWLVEQGRDIWCKECAQEHCTTKLKLQEYCWYNNRTWTDLYWDKAKLKASHRLANCPEYLDENTSPERKAVLEEETACRAFLGMMNFGGAYMFIENNADPNDLSEFNPDSLSGTLDREAAKMQQDDSKAMLQYSPEWNGLYTRHQIDYLDKYYADLEDSFVLADRNTQDCARKVAKASLALDIVQDKYQRGIATLADVKEAQVVFEKLSGMGAFSASKRTGGQSIGMGSLGEIITKIEIMGQLQTVEVKFPEDDIDRITADFRHTMEAVGAGG